MSHAVVDTFSCCSGYSLMLQWIFTSLEERCKQSSQLLLLAPESRVQKRRPLSPLILVGHSTKHVIVHYGKWSRTIEDT